MEGHGAASHRPLRIDRIKRYQCHIERLFDIPLMALEVELCFSQNIADFRVGLNPPNEILPPSGFSITMRALLFAYTTVASSHICLNDFQNPM